MRESNVTREYEVEQIGGGMMKNIAETAVGDGQTKQIGEAGDGVKQIYGGMQIYGVVGDGRTKQVVGDRSNGVKRQVDGDTNEVKVVRDGQGKQIGEMGDGTKQVGSERKEIKVVGGDGGRDLVHMGEMGDGMELQVLGDDLIEGIFLCLPIRSCIRLASLSKRWYSFIQSPSFMRSSISATHPFFYVWGLDPSTLRTLACAYDPMAARWFTLNLTNNMQPLSSPSHSYGLTSTASGTLILYPNSRPSADNVILRFTRNPMNTDWGISSVASKSFGSSPTVAAFDANNIPLSSSFEVFVLCEVCGVPTVQLYTSATDSWEVCVSSFSPWGLYQFLGSLHVSSAVAGRKIYLANISTGIITYFSMDTKLWNPLSKLRSWDTRHFLISSTNRGLHAVGLSAVDQAEECVKLFKVDEVTMECKEVSKMPGHLWSVLVEEFEQGTHSVLAFSYFKCTGAGSLIYLYNGSYFNTVRVCVCNIEAGYRWHQLSALPADLQKLEVRAECCSFQLLSTTCLKSQYVQ